MDQKYNDFEGLTDEEKLKVYNDCICCDRHQLNKPKKLEKWREVPAVPPRPGFEDLKLDIFGGNLCSCDCRHKARFLCRQVE